MGFVFSDDLLPDVWPVGEMVLGRSASALLIYTVANEQGALR